MPQQFMTMASRWSALQARDPRATDSFIYSVITTKVYCRPTCPSRLARRANIIFHNNVAEAEAAGFRACKRCLPDLSLEEYAAEGRKAKVVVEKVSNLLGDELVAGKGAKKWTVRMLAAEVGLTESYFCRLFKKEVGCTVGAFRGKLASLQQQLEKEDEHSTHPGPVANTKSIPETFDATMAQWPFDTTEAYFNTADILLGTILQPGEDFSQDLSYQDSYANMSGPNFFVCPEQEEDGLQFLDLSSLN